MKTHHYEHKRQNQQVKMWKTAACKHKHQFKQIQIKTSGNQVESSKIKNKPQNQNENLDLKMEIRISYKERNPITASVRGEEEMSYGKRRDNNLQWICSAEQAIAPPSLPLSFDTIIPIFIDNSRVRFLCVSVLRISSSFKLFYWYGRICWW